MAKKKEVGTTPPVLLSIRAKTAGFRRAGRVWSTMAEVVDAVEFDDDQLAALRECPGMVVIALDSGAAKAVDAAREDDAEEREGQPSI